MGIKNAKNQILRRNFMENKEEIKKKTADERAKDQEANNLMNFIIAKTFSRHSKMTEEEFLKDIGFENSGKTEDEAVRIAKFNVIVETMNQLLKARQAIKLAHSLLKTCLIDEKITEDGVKGE